MFGWGVPHAAPGPFAPTPPHGRTILQVRGNVGRVWSPQISMFTCRSLKAARDRGRGVHGPHLPRSRRSREGESVASRSQH